MKLIAALSATLLMLGAPPALYHFGEADLFWFVILELAAIMASIAAIAFAFFSSIDFSK